MQTTPSLHTPSRAVRLYWGGALGVVVAIALGLLRGETELFESLELRAIDARTQYFADTRRADRRILIMQIEESDVQDVRRDLGQPWPWPLEYNAHIVDVLQEAGAEVLMVDILHLDKGAGPDDVPDSDSLPEAARQQREIEAQSAAVYGAALERFGKAAVGYELALRPEYDVPARREVAMPRLGSEGFDASDQWITYRGANLPVRRVGEKARILGFTNAWADFDGVSRHAKVFGRLGEHGALSLPLATALLANGGALRRTEHGIAIGDTTQALMKHGRFLVNHHDERYRELRPAGVLAWAIAKENTGTLPAAARETVEGKIIVFGINLVGQKDVLASPLGGDMDGPVWQATVLDNLLHGDGRVRMWRVLDMLLMGILAVLAGALGTVAPTRWLPHAVPLVLGGAFVLLAMLLFRAGTSIDMVTPLLALLLVWGGTFALRSLTEGRRNRWLEGVFGRYMSPALVAALKRDPSLISLGGREREISIFFSDVAGFTSLSERLRATEVVELLNRYLTDHCAAVMRQDGVIDKFEGDAVMAFFGDPVEQPDHALRACHAALAVQAALPDLEPLLRKLDVPEFRVRIGINSGRAVVGNMGSTQRFDYTCIGDSVNLASRLEGAGKAFGVHILIGEATARAVEDTMLLKPLGGLIVVGKEEPVGVYELLATKAQAPAELTAHVEAFTRALGAARAGDVAAARAALEEAANHRPDDGPVAWLRGVLEDLDGAWDGVTVLGHK